MGKRVTHSTRRSAGRRRGQSLVEFALMLPFLMLLLVGGLDFGRVFLGWVELNNAVRVAANFAAENPTAWGTPGDASAVTEYQREITADASAIDCALPSPLPSPSFPGGTGVGSPAQVNLSCGFRLITPLMGNLVGNPLTVSAAAAFPIRAGTIPGIPAASVVPVVPTPTPSPAPTATPEPTASPVPTCTVPKLVGDNVQQATAAWGPGQGSTTGAGFTTQVIFNPQVPPNYQVGHQNIDAGTVLPCGSTVITVTP